MRASGCLALLLASVTLAAGVARGGRRDWTGSAACGACHPAELAAWQATPHARTRARFPTRPEGRCLGCHATGEAPAGPAIAVEVGCEACHGAGAAYAEDDVMRDLPLARALGLIDGRGAPPSGSAAEGQRGSIDVASPKSRAAVCAPCHRRPTRGTPFDPTAAVHPVAIP